MSAMSNQPTLDQDSTIRLVLELSKRTGRAVPIRRALAQITLPKPKQRLRRKTESTSPEPACRPTKPGPLHELVEQRRNHALDVLLLVYAATSGGDFGVSHFATTWSRSIGASFEKRSASSQMTKVWNQLAEAQLIKRAGQQGRRARVIKLREDGTGAEYTVPVGGSLEEVYFKLPFAYWLEGWHSRLSLPAKGVLLAAMSRRSADIPITDEGFSRWYGFSAATVARGREQLLQLGLIEKTGEEEYPSLNLINGVGTRPLYSLRPPFTLSQRPPEQRPAGIVIPPPATGAMNPMASDVPR